jgi:hypothetical protein
MWLPRVTPICCTGSRLRKTRRVSRGKPFWACDILDPAKNGEREGGLLGARVADFVAFDCTSQKKRRLTVTWLTRCKRCQKQRQRGLKTAHFIPEMSAVLEMCGPDAETDRRLKYRILDSSHFSSDSISTCQIITNTALLYRNRSLYGRVCIHGMKLYSIYP